MLKQKKELEDRIDKSCEILKRDIKKEVKEMDEFLNM